MTAFTPKVVASLDPQKPLKTTLINQLWDNTTHAKERLDILDSSILEVFQNSLRNGSFESGSTGWTLTPYTGGTAVVQTTGAMHGNNCIAITSTVLANGGGDALNVDFMPVAGNVRYGVAGSLMSAASISNISSSIDVIWYNAAQAVISTSTVHAYTSTPIVQDNFDVVTIAPTTARYARVRVKGGVPATGTATGTIYFDGLSFYKLHNDENVTFTSSGTWTKPTTLDPTAMILVEVWGGGGGGAAATGGGGGGGAYNARIFQASELGATVSVTVGAGGAVSTSGGNSSFGIVTAFGGGTAITGNGGGGGGTKSAGGNIAGGLGYGTLVSSGASVHGIFDNGGGGSASTSRGGCSVWGGGGGASASADGGSSLFGGGGGGAGLGVSLYGGNGGNVSAGVAPGGGGAFGFVGARGEIRVRVLS